MNSDLLLRSAQAARLRFFVATLVLLALGTLAPQLRAAADVALEARIGFGQSATGASRYRPGTWTPITVYLTGQGARGVGQLTVAVRQSGHATSYTRKISLHDGPLNEAYGFVFDLRPLNYGMMGGGSSPEISAQLVLDGRELAKRKFSLPLAVGDETFNILALTRDGSGMNFLAKKKLALIHLGVSPARLQNRFGTAGQSGTGYDALEKVTSEALLYTDPRALPAMPQGYAMIDAITLGDLPLDNLTEDQISALQTYVRDGGLLVISGGGDLSRLKSQFYKEMLPVTPASAVSVTGGAPELAALEARYHEPLFPQPSRTGVTVSATPSSPTVELTVGTLRPNSTVLFGPSVGAYEFGIGGPRRKNAWYYLQKDSAGITRGGVTGFGLVAARPYGAGFVVFTAFDFLSPEFRGWRQTPSLWRDILRCGNHAVSPRQALSNQAHLASQGAGRSLIDAMAGRQAGSAPGLPIVAAFLAIYLILLVPASYLLLKKLDKRELAWFTAPALVLGFTVVSYLIAVSIKGSALIANRIVVLESQANTEQVAGYGQMTIYSPRRAAYDIGLGPPGEAGRPYHSVAPAEIFEASASSLGDMTVEHDQTTKIRGAEVRLWDKRSFDTPVFTNLGGPVAIETDAADDTHVRVAVTNKTRFTLQNCAVVNDKGQEIAIGRLAPGETQKLKEPLVWAYKESSTSVRMPQAPASWQSSNSINDRKRETPDQIRNNLRFALTQALTSTNGASQAYSPYYNGVEEATETFGKATNAFVGWIEPMDRPLLDVQIDGKPVAGEEACLLYVHLPAARNLPREVARATNPFLQEPILNLKDEAPGTRVIP